MISTTRKEDPTPVSVWALAREVFRQVQGIAQQQEETDRKMKETDRRIRKLGQEIDKARDLLKGSREEFGRER